ncbi:MAG: uracil-DNA glycosylase [Clostridia bacterium]|jgi:DNA polymerase
MEKIKSDSLKKLYDLYTEEAASFDPQYNMQFVFSDGKMQKGIMLIGEAPGKDEVAQNKPFVGMAGGKLRHFMDSLSLTREDVFVTNAIKFRLYDISLKTGRMKNRPASKKEILQGAIYLEKEIEIISPKIILTLGNVPLHALTKDFSMTVGMCHGHKLNYKGIIHIPLYHPASLIYNKNLESVYEEDIKTVRMLIS